MVSEEIEEYFLKISENPLDTLSQYIAPHLVGREWYWVRRATLLLLTTQDTARTRIRLHILLCGPAGTGKTEFLLWMREHLEGVLINAELTSKVGLTGDARGNEIKPGLLADCDRNIILVDELDKMPSKDQNGLLQAMEEGKYSIIKGRLRNTFTAEIRVIGTTNSLRKIQKPLLDRFDFIFYVGTPPREERANNIDKIVNSFTNGQNEKYGEIIMEYLKWIGDYDASITSEDKWIIKDMVKRYILTTRTDIDYVSYRSFEFSILRIAYALAKLEKTSIKDRHIDTAIWLKDQILKNIVGELDQGRRY